MIVRTLSLYLRKETHSNSDSEIDMGSSFPHPPMFPIHPAMFPPGQSLTSEIFGREILIRDASILYRCWNVNGGTAAVSRNGR